MRCYNKAWYKKNKKSADKRRKEWHKKNYVPHPLPRKTPEEKEATRRKYYEEHREYYREKNKQYHEAHKNDEEYMERKRIITREYYKKLKEKERLLEELLKTK